MIEQKETPEETEKKEGISDILKGIFKRVKDEKKTTHHGYSRMHHRHSRS